MLVSCHTTLDKSEFVPSPHGAVASMLFKAVSTVIEARHLSFGGGAVLAGRWRHRRSFDVDLFCDSATFRRLTPADHAAIEREILRLDGCDPDRTWCESDAAYTELNGIEATVMHADIVFEDGRASRLASRLEGTSLAMQSSAGYCTRRYWTACTAAPKSPCAISTTSPAPPFTIPPHWPKRSSHRARNAARRVGAHRDAAARLDRQGLEAACRAALRLARRRACRAGARRLENERGRTRRERVPTVIGPRRPAPPLRPDAAFAGCDAVPLSNAEQIAGVIGRKRCAGHRVRVDGRMVLRTLAAAPAAGDANDAIRWMLSTLAPRECLMLVTRCGVNPRHLARHVREHAIRNAGAIRFLNQFAV